MILLKNHLYNPHAHSRERSRAAPEALHTECWDRHHSVPVAPFRYPGIIPMKDSKQGWYSAMSIQESHRVTAASRYV